MTERPVLIWFPMYAGDLMSSPAYTSMLDYQQAWFINLLINGWLNSERPGYLRNNPDRLWRLANAQTKRFFERENSVVMAKFQCSVDGDWLYNQRLLDVYEEQLGKFLHSGGGQKTTKETKILSVSISDLGLLEIYNTYPRKTKKKYSLECIKKAIIEVSTLQSLTHEAAAEKIFQAVRRYAKSPAGNNGTYTPHCSTWMNQGQYDDDPAEWDKTAAQSDRPKGGPCALHPNSGLTSTGGCWTCYSEAQ